VSVLQTSRSLRGGWSWFRQGRRQARAEVEARAEVDARTEMRSRATDGDADDGEMQSRGRSCGRRAGGGDEGGGAGGAGGCEREQRQSGKGKSDERELEIVRRLQL
jgi:hypothetical protein